MALGYCEYRKLAIALTSRGNCEVSVCTGPRSDQNPPVCTHLQSSGALCPELLRKSAHRLVSRLISPNSG